MFKTSKRVSEGVKCRQQKAAMWEDALYFGDIKGTEEYIFIRYFRLQGTANYQKLQRAALKRIKRFYGLDNKYTGSGKLKKSIC